MTDNVNRIPTGVPTGGQFATSTRAETNSTLAPADTEPTSEQAIRSWLLAYAWMDHSDAVKAAEVDCIMAQGEWRHLEARVENLMAQCSGENDLDTDIDDAEGFALSALYECHEAPHSPACPYFKAPSNESEPS